MTRLTQGARSRSRASDEIARKLVGWCDHNREPPPNVAETCLRPKLAIGGLVIGGVVLYVRPKTWQIARAALGAAAKSLGRF